MGAKPGDDALHGGLAGAEQAAVLHQLADADIFAAVLPGIADPHHSAVGQAQPARALDLEEEEVDRVGGPGDFEAAAGERPVLDLGALVIRDDDPVLEPAAARRSGGLGGGGVDFDEVGRLAVDRHLIAGLAGARAGDLGLEIAGDEGGAVADLDELEMLGEEGRRRARSGRRRRRRPAASPRAG